MQARNARVEQLAHSRNLDEKHEERLAELAEERARKVGEREAKEAKAQQRRKDMEDRRLRKGGGGLAHMTSALSGGEK